ncbi:hypothetical protein COCSADRAFT_190052 [Bipolaris sorokiniana ND90Pr]|uniref:Uncharacterized protein n=1 Tax=Cochliobolus sativus (strain ND90Pr / ATCC 201652) TaxID=665912 RepID=M2SCS4_COCSN|nr:uncharacterized protein COCSADRAFT_190052 [Bipolaris sorokiniana ND90Pr]EMD65073.1 hypothetical protein COCSADRAFT_190052 [Bipolaris sorokiniana ND90Pr]
MSSGPSGSAPERERSGPAQKPQPQPSSQKAPSQPKEIIDLTMTDEETSPTMTVSTGSRATSTEPTPTPIKFSLRPVYRLIDLTLESDEDKDVIGGMHEKSNPDPKDKKKEVIVKKKSEKEVKRVAQLDHMAVMFTPAQAIAALTNPNPLDITYDMKTGERFTFPVKRSYNLGAMGRYMPSVADDKASAAEKKESTKGKGKAPAEGKGSTRDKASAADK